MHKKQHHPRSRRIEFGMSGVLIGLFGGMLAGFVIEIGAGGGALMMTLGGMSGAIIGMLCEAVRFWWQKRGDHDERQDRANLS